MTGMWILLHFFTVIVSKGFASYNGVFCNSSQLQSCRCNNLSEWTVAVNCSRTNIGIDDACSICSQVRNVTKLDLSSNNITGIPESCFKDCTGVTWLSLASNDIYFLQKGMFVNMKRLRSLNIDNNMLVSDCNFSSPKALDSLKELQILRVRRNVKSCNSSASHKYLSNISPRLPWLQKLFLDGLPYGSFGENFHNSMNLTVIDFSGFDGFCSILGLSSSSFVNTPYLTNLTLTKCKISTIESGTFELLSHLIHLNLSFNLELGFGTLRNISYGLQNTSIKVLDYSKVYKTFGVTNQLKRCDIWYLQNTTLKELRLNSNRMSSVEVDGLHFFPASLEILRAEDNSFGYGPYVFQTGCISSLKRLDISGRLFPHDLNVYNDELDIKEKENIGYVPEACKVPLSMKRKNCKRLSAKKLNPFLFTMPKTLKTVNMRRFGLYLTTPTYNTSISESKNKIEAADLSNNVLYQWGGKFIAFEKLKHLDLSKNFCSNVSHEFFMNSPNLVTLDVSINKLGEVLARDFEGLIFKPLQKLTKINLSYNDITNLPDKIFIHLNILQALNLSFNHIHDVNFNFRNMTRLSVLDLKQNKISTLPIPLLDQMHSYSKRNQKTNISIDLSQNIIDLTCENLKFLNWMAEHIICFKNVDTYQFIRKDGRLVSYSNFSSILVELDKSCRSYTAVYIVSVISITTFIAIVSAGLIYRFRWRLRYFYYMARSKYTGYIPLHDPDGDERFQYDAFISYANDDLDFVRDEIVERLEDEDTLTLCIHQRDFTPGRYIAENILRAIKNSRSTVILLSRNFLQSKWCLYEFNMARMEGIYSRCGENIIFVIMYEDVDMSHLSPEMLECLETESFLKYPSDDSEIPFFWQTLKQTLTTRRN